VKGFKRGDGRRALGKREKIVASGLGGQTPKEQEGQGGVWAEGGGGFYFKGGLREEVKRGKKEPGGWGRQKNKKRLLWAAFEFFVNWVRLMGGGVSRVVRRGRGGAPL